MDGLSTKVQYFQQEAERKADDARKADSDRLDWKRKMQTERHATDVEMQRLREAKESAEAALDVLRISHSDQVNSELLGLEGRSRPSTHEELVAQVFMALYWQAATWLGPMSVQRCRFEGGSRCSKRD
jgi:hypothetical protein